ncbi:putative Zn-dependent protease DUF2268 [Hephaestia caeni]|uniref:Putative Zn-dependent protease DUF2268 n=1 Tax=Hephaestia caeni TaxID=645617 RepID=A0A397PD28_9SPHN|nr:DUF2268 domain-containing putative Zn-dependent protease [Hephaestia caeni]RIA46878.1 putative Zn-dependent protease DUF2268 [Hephaestia caeni]
MRRSVLFLLAGLALSGAAPARAPYHALTHDFERFHDRTAEMPEAARVALFRKSFDRLFPGFYEPSPGQSDVEFDRQVAKALNGFAAIRPQYERVEHDFPAAYAKAMEHFRTFFPGFRPTLPVWFIHSLGRMDGGTRTIRGTTYLVFGADVIARIHSDGTIGPFLDHELFHVENGRWFKDCAPETTVWCALWQEGGATYAAAQMNPGADDHALMLDQPKPIRAAVDADWRAALCTTKRDFDADTRDAYSGYFLADGAGRFPARWGYYVGYRLLQRVGEHHSLSDIDHMDHRAARAALTKALDAAIAEAGGCA